MSSPTLQQGIEAVKGQRFEEGARLLRITIKDTSLTPNLRALAWMWLAETQSDVTFKINCYQQAIAIDPNYTDAQQRLQYYMSQQLPDPPSPPQQTRQNIQPDLSSSQGMPPVNPQGGYVSGMTPSQDMPPVNPQSGYMSGMTPSQGMPPVNPQQQPNQGNFTTGYAPNQTMQNVHPQNNFVQQSAPPPTKIVLNTLQTSVGVRGSANGTGSGFFVTRDGLVVTSRFTVGGESALEIALADGRTVTGEVVRSFTEYDIALIRTPIQVQKLLQPTSVRHVAENTPLIIQAHAPEARQNTHKSATKHKTLTDYWIPLATDRNLDAGGAPIFDQRRLLVGMMTRNISRSSKKTYAIHIDAVFQCVDIYMQEIQQYQNSQYTYCVSCGNLSRSISANGGYCETCGALMPYADASKLFPNPAHQALSGETMNRPCPNCKSQAGYHDGFCLRCGAEVGTPRLSQELL